MLLTKSILSTNYDSSILFGPASITCDLSSIATTNEFSFMSTLLNPSLLTQHYTLDYTAKSSYIDTLLVLHSWGNTSSTRISLYTGFNQDSVIFNNTYCVALYAMSNSEFQDKNTDMLLIAPEISFAYLDYARSYLVPASFDTMISAVFDSYLNVSASSPSEVVDTMVLVPFYTFLLLYIVSLLGVVTSSSIHNTVTPRLNKVILYFYSLSRSTRTQQESLYQTLGFFVFYWSAMLLTADDSQEEVIDLVGSVYFYLLLLLVAYLCYKHSIQYLAFLDGSVGSGRAVKFVLVQFSKDILSVLAISLRFSILLLRVNVYDALDDFLDSYYIFVGDFEDDNYFNEVALSTYCSILSVSENESDVSYLTEGEHESDSDLLFVYYLVWGKLFYFTLFLIEEAARLVLAFYVFYLVIFEVHSVNCTYNETYSMCPARR